MKLPTDTHFEYHQDSAASQSNWLRAAVLGANDGIVSLAALVVGVAGASDSTNTIFVTGLAGLLAGALSMAVGEYVSVSSQKDTEIALLEKERFELEHYPDQELAELAGIYEKKGLSRATAEIVAKELTAHDAFGAHVEAELKLDPHERTNPLQAAFASAASFIAGAVIPFVAILLPPASIKIPVTFVAVLIALVATGIISARISGAPVLKATSRMVAGGILAMLITFGIGTLFGVKA
jgi:vacuolar iron transporter family protein